MGPLMPAYAIKERIEDDIKTGELMPVKELNDESEKVNLTNNYNITIYDQKQYIHRDYYNELKNEIRSKKIGLIEDGKLILLEDALMGFNDVSKRIIKEYVKDKLFSFDEEIELRDHVIEKDNKYVLKKELEEEVERIREEYEGLAESNEAISIKTLMNKAWNYIGGIVNPLISNREYDRVDNYYNALQGLEIKLNDFKVKVGNNWYVRKEDAKDAVNKVSGLNNLGLVFEYAVNEEQSKEDEIQRIIPVNVEPAPITTILFEKEENSRIPVNVEPAPITTILFEKEEPEVKKERIKIPVVGGPVRRCY